MFWIIINQQSTWLTRKKKKKAFDAFLNSKKLITSYNENGIWSSRWNQSIYMTESTTLKFCSSTCFWILWKLRTELKRTYKNISERLRIIILRTSLWKTESRKCAISTSFSLSIQKTNQSKRSEISYWHDINHKDDQRSERWWIVLKNWITSTRSQSKS